MTFSSLLSIRSHPVRVRGLKLLCELAKATGGRVAPHVGAWIEVQTAIQCWKVCIGVALAVGDETTADGAEFHPPLLCCACRPFRKEGRRCCCCCQVV